MVVLIFKLKKRNRLGNGINRKHREKKTEINSL